MVRVKRLVIPGGDHPRFPDLPPRESQLESSGGAAESGEGFLVQAGLAYLPPSAC